jgi:antitoxin (DNA-binding transcriptional repressor) of toxin-antitoxin stability system
MFVPWLDFADRKRATMPAMTVGEIKRHFSEVLDKVQSGTEYQILYGRAKKPIARIVPIYVPGPSICGIGKNCWTANWLIGKNCCEPMLMKELRVTTVTKSINARNF